jgi:sugar phosphate isomerase/epimerase
MYFSCSTTLFRLRPVHEAIEGIAKAGFCAVELMADHPHALPEDLDAVRIAGIASNLEDAKVKVSNLDTCHPLALSEGSRASWISGNWQDRERRIRYTLDSLRVAAAMGIPGVTVEASGPFPADFNRFDAWRIFVASMHRVLPLAKRLGVRLLIQPAPEALVANSREALELLRELEEYDWLRIDFDASYLFSAGEYPREAWDKLKSHVGHIHIADIAENRANRRLQLGKGVMDLPGFLGCVRDSEYDGFLTFRPDDFEGSAEEAVKSAVEHLRQEGFM